MAYTNDIVNSNSEINWPEVIKKEARGINDADFGEVQEVVIHFILTEKGLITKEKYYFPTGLVKGFDGDIVRFRIAEDDLLNKYREGFGATATAVGETETERTILLTEERLEVSKDVQEQHATIIKEPITETKTVQVPVTHEEISIERRKPNKNQSHLKKKYPFL